MRTHARIELGEVISGPRPRYRRVLGPKTVYGVSMELRLFVFHHAGGSHLPYRDWPGRFPAGWDVRTPDAPGHGLLMDRPAIGDALRLVDHFRTELDAELTGPYALFGHSMGGLIAYELTRRLVAEGRTPPVWLGLSARGTPRPDGDDDGTPDTCWTMTGCAASWPRWAAHPPRSWRTPSCGSCSARSSGATCGWWRPGARPPTRRRCPCRCRCTGAPPTRWHRPRAWPAGPSGRSTSSACVCSRAGTSTSSPTPPR